MTRKVVKLKPRQIRAVKPEREPQPVRVDMQVVYEHRDKIEKILLSHLKRMWQVPDGNLLPFMREQNMHLAAFLRDEEYLLAYAAGEHNEQYEDDE